MRKIVKFILSSFKDIKTFITLKYYSRKLPYSIKYKSIYIGSKEIYERWCIKKVFIPSRLHKYPVKKILEGTFEKSLVETVYIEDGIVSIEKEAFKDCVNLRKIRLPNTLKSLGVECFSGCESLESIILPEGIQEIPTKCFENCLSLKEIILPKSLRLINNKAFKKCISLSYPNTKSSNIVIRKEAFSYCLSFTNIVINSGVILEGDSVFNYCSRLRKVIVKKGNTVSLPMFTFYRCTNLRDVSLPSNLHDIGSHCFAGCVSLTGSFVFPSSLSKIGSGGFAETSFEKIDLSHTQIEVLSENLFSSCKKLSTVLLPKTCTKIEARCFLRSNKLTTLFIQNPISIDRNALPITNSSFCLNIKTTLTGEKHEIVVNNDELTSFLGDSLILNLQTISNWYYSTEKNPLFSFESMFVSDNNYEIL